MTTIFGGEEEERTDYNLTKAVWVRVRGSGVRGSAGVPSVSGLSLIRRDPFFNPLNTNNPMFAVCLRVKHNTTEATGQFLHGMTQTQMFARVCHR